jgi:hypothetical protein
MIKIFAAAASLVLSATAVQASPLAFNDSPQAQARTVINVVFGDYLAQRVAAKVETAVVDLDNDGVGEIVARFVHSGSCSTDMKVCRTVVVRHDKKNWRIVLDHPAATVEKLEGVNGVPAPVKVDRVTWKWKFPTYSPTPEGMGEPISMESVPQNAVASLSPAFGAGAAKLVAADPRYGLTFARPNISDKDEFLAVTLQGGSACGEKTGCPVRILRKDKDGWRPVLAASVANAMLLGNAQRDGYRDLVVDTKQGFAVYGWNGSKYILADRVEVPEGGQK